MKKQFNLETFVCKFMLSVMLFVLRSYLVLIVWNWRLVTFVSEMHLPQISFDQACSLQASIIILVVGILRFEPRVKKEDESEYYSYFESSFITGLFIVLVWAFSYLLLRPK